MEIGGCYTRIPETPSRERQKRTKTNEARSKAIQGSESQSLRPCKQARARIYKNNARCASTVFVLSTLACSRCSKDRDHPNCPNTHNVYYLALRQPLAKTQHPPLKQQRFKNRVTRRRRHGTGLDYASKADVWCNRHRKTSPVDLDGSQGLL